MSTAAAGLAGSARAWLEKTGGLAVRRVISVLVLMSLADVATTAVALSWGAPELSPGGAAALAVAGVAGLVGLKMVAFGVLWFLERIWPAVGRAVSGGLACITTAAVTWNVCMLGNAGFQAVG